MRTSSKSGIKLIITICNECHRVQHRSTSEKNVTNVTVNDQVENVTNFIENEAGYNEDLLLLTVTNVTDQVENCNKCHKVQ